MSKSVFQSYSPAYFAKRFFCAPRSAGAGNTVRGTGHYFAGRDGAGVASLFAGAVIGHTADGALTNFGLAENCAVARTTAYGAERTLIAWAMSCS